jgi:Fe-S oxidoreductase
VNTRAQVKKVMADNKNHKNQTSDNCNLCGLCNLSCPIYAVLLKESAGSRFKVFLAKKKQLKEIFFLCTTCGACIQGCPANVVLGCLEIRKALVDKGVVMPANNIMRENIKRFGNSLGPAKKAKIKQYYT